MVEMLTWLKCCNLTNPVFMGTSVRNQRIERLWGDVYQVTTQLYKTMNFGLHNILIGFSMARVYGSFYIFYSMLIEVGRNNLSI